MKKNDRSRLGRGQPRYLLLAQDLIQDIDTGRYPVGSLLPTELELCEQFGVSRHTVREAVRRLREMGLVTRHQGIGTRVKAKAATTRYVQSIGSIADMFQYAKNTRLEVQKTRELTADEDLAQLLWCKPGQRWLKAEALRYVVGESVPISYTELYVSKAYKGIRKLIGAQLPVYALVEQQYGEHIAEVKQDISAVTIPESLAAMLQTEPGAPGLRITRHYLGEDDKMLEVSMSIHPADRFSYAMRLRREWQMPDRED